MPDLDFPYHFSGLGRTATTDRDDHIRDLIQQVLYVNDSSGVRCEVYEQPHSARLQPNCLPLARELIQVWIDPPLTNAPDL